jgi:acetyltransferase-like isoleucine patch superfamily enzyme
MPAKAKPRTRIVKAVHGFRKVDRDPAFEIELSKFLSRESNQAGLLDLYRRFVNGEDSLSLLIRRAIFRSIVRRCGDGLVISGQVGFKHLETFEFGSGIFIGAGTYLQGRFDGKCKIGNHVWIGPQSYFDARDLMIEDFVGWGPGAKVLGSQHTGVPIDVPIVQTGLEIKPVRIGAWADIGTNAVILPGVTVGQCSMVGAGAVVTEDVPPYAVVAGVPARFLHWRDANVSKKQQRNFTGRKQTRIEES